MKIQREPLTPLAGGAVVTIGAYDGVHLGHGKVLELVRELADARSFEAVLATFDQHPASVVRPESAPKLLTTLEQRLELLDETGLLDRCVVLHFDEARSRETADEFVREVLVDGLGAKVVVVGADFHFGHQRAGNVALLESMGTDLGFEVIGLGLVAPEGDAEHHPYSSTRIRELLAAGDVAAAAELLGRPHELRGEVVIGDRRGRELGFPTANVEAADELCRPADGIYAGSLVHDGVERPAAISIGRRPTFHGSNAPVLVEAFVLDFDGDLYGEQVAIRFRTRLRAEQKFDSVGALKAQMQRDVEATRALAT